ncbi:sulfotransferase family protein [Winogradskyella schleiferi]|uniref:sulfotransferase family protein n=1 Tax=Winogradskyella schleiferi TaxID=2686078 RepID=UPI0015BD6E8F|nr:sulfotransferase [Winogradskyella schleiferi]
MIKKKKQRKIDFILGGAQKSGTSALAYYLRQHPDVGMGEVKELHYFNNEAVFSKKYIDYSKYENRFDFNQDKLIYGEATPIYLYWVPAAERIWNYNSDIKLIFILRNPIHRAFSHWNMEFDRPKESNETKDFSYAIRNERLRVREKLPLQHMYYSYLDRGYYSEQIRRYKRFFKDEQLMFIKYENFKNNQNSVLNQIFSFLNVNEENFNFKERVINEHKKHSNLNLQDKEYLLNLYEFEIKQVEKILDWDCSDWLE